MTKEVRKMNIEKELGLTLEAVMIKCENVKSAKEINRICKAGENIMNEKIAEASGQHNGSFRDAMRRSIEVNDASQFYKKLLEQFRVDMVRAWEEAELQVSVESDLRRVIKLGRC